jgi:16S rRNA (guanine527-N7)-methyltransferase
MKIIQKYFDLTASQVAQFESLQAIYSDWNSRINLISRKDIDNLYERHVLHSLAIAKIIQFNKGTKVMDAGTGGGFPGIPLAIMFPDTEFLLVDSMAKKIKVVDSIIHQLRLNNVNAIQARVEEVKEQFDFVVSRAVADMATFVKWVQGKIIPECRNSMANGILYLKGEDSIIELEKLDRSFEVFPLSSFFKEDFFKTKVILHLTENSRK